MKLRLCFGIETYCGKGEGLVGGNLYIKCKSIHGQSAGLDAVASFGKLCHNSGKQMQETGEPFTR